MVERRIKYRSAAVFLDGAYRSLLPLEEVPVGRRLDAAKHRKIDFADLNWNERYLISNP